MIGAHLFFFSIRLIRKTALNYLQNSLKLLNFNLNKKSKRAASNGLTIALRCLMSIYPPQDFEWKAIYATEVLKSNPN